LHLASSVPITSTLLTLGTRNTIVRASGTFGDPSGQAERTGGHAVVPIIPSCFTMAWTGFDCDMEDHRVPSSDASMLHRGCDTFDHLDPPLGAASRVLDTGPVGCLLVHCDIGLVPDNGVLHSLDLGVADRSEDANQYLVVEDQRWQGRDEAMEAGSSG